ncbi:MAG: hypothetical protein K8S87_03300 [Planctomycetes bacterium]|nr:hypothetical protein [Planctomycetota bacterium]
MKYAILAVLVVISVLSVQLFAGSTGIVIEKLQQTKIDVNYDEMSLEDVLADIKTKTGVSVIIDPKSAKEIDIEDIEITMKLTEIAAYDLLKAIARHAEMRIVFKYGMVWMVTPEHYYDGRNIVKIYDVRDITMKIRDFPGVSIRLKGNSTGDNEIDWVEEEETYEPIIIDDLEDLIPDFVAKGNWDENPGASIQQLSGMLIIRQAPEVHYEIMKLLAEIRSNS